MLACQRVRARCWLLLFPGSLWHWKYLWQYTVACLCYPLVGHTRGPIYVLLLWRLSGALPWPSCPREQL